MMKNLNMRVLLLSVLFLFAAPLPAMVQATQRASKPAFKGVELYSWKNGPSKQWSFALMPGTNRNKTLAEITEPRRAISGVSELKGQLAKLAEGEQVFWFLTISPRELSHPGPEVVAEIVRFAADRKVEISIGDIPSGPPTRPSAGRENGN